MWCRILTNCKPVAARKYNCIFTPMSGIKYNCIFTPMSGIKYNCIFTPMSGIKYNCIKMLQRAIAIDLLSLLVENLFKKKDKHAWNNWHRGTRIFHGQIILMWYNHYHKNKCWNHIVNMQSYPHDVDTIRLRSCTMYSIYHPSYTFVTLYRIS